MPTLKVSPAWSPRLCILSRDSSYDNDLCEVSHVHIMLFDSWKSPVSTVASPHYTNGETERGGPGGIAQLADGDS